MTNLYLDYGYGSHVGLRRELNEDSSVVTDTLFAVADGMGGHEAGEVASALAVQALADGWDRSEGHLTQQHLQQFIDDADERIRQATDSKAGTTLTGAALLGAENNLTWLVFNVGDSRTYVFHDGALLQLTRDHSQVQEMFESGIITEEELHSHPQRNVITRALGAGDLFSADFSTASVVAGQRVLVCSDGLTGELTNSDISEIMGRGESAQATVDLLIQRALSNGGRDNVTVIVVDVKEDHGSENDTKKLPVAQE